MRWQSAVIAFSVATFVAASAHADEPDREPPSAWYGWQTGLADLATISVMFVSASNASRAGELVGLATFAASGPVIHLAHGNPRSAGMSTFMRTLAPLASVAVVFCGTDFRWGGPHQEYRSAALLAAPGIGVAAVLDMIFLGRRHGSSSTPPVDDRRDEAPMLSGHVTPTVVPTIGGVAVGASAIF